VTAVEIDKQPALIFTATKIIEVGEELLYDYNDTESRAALLKNCPVCSDTGFKPTDLTGHLC